MIGQRYGTALFDLATEQDTVSTVYADVAALQKIFAQTPAVGAALTNVTLSKSQKQAILANLKQGASASVQNLIQMVFDYGRMQEMPDILAAFMHQYDLANGIVRAEVTSAVALTEAQQESLATQLATRLGVKQVKIKNNIDKTIIGGAIVKANNLIIDGSVQKKLLEVRQLLLG
ncbi:F0F1 ATP synthase subunit delta [Loigolactobacillus rennini DSM 20253]|uniref:ATP synthase subunit delta n=2 Tax=Loigolactobacillus rennini TaxID=238013 RepID=A0A0R2D3X6_9LACO|nr:F0F1 ATP synthase subunit delta [Loigolactobacillus rennini DSM 20253]